MAETFYSKEQLELRDKYRALVKEHIVPAARDIDEKDRIPKELVQKLVKPPFSLTALSVPKKYGGLELPKVNVCIIAEEIGYGLPCLIPFLEIAQLYTYVIKLGGTEEQQKRFLSRIAAGEIGCYALTNRAGRPRGHEEHGHQDRRRLFAQRQEAPDHLCGHGRPVRAFRQ